MAAIIPLLRYICDGATLPIVWLIVSSALIAILELLLRASLYPLYRELGIFLPLTSIALLPLARQEMLREAPAANQLFKRALSMCAGLMLAGGVLGTGRELVGHGSIFYDAPQLWGPWAHALPLRLFSPDMGFLLAVLAPGAFIGLGLGVALYNWLWLRIRPASSPIDT
jgi:electron transport complex protein RnfE